MSEEKPDKKEKVNEYLEEQKNLTAVERFSEMHEKGKIPQQEKYYKALLPSAPPGPGQQYAFEVNLDKCSGCKACITGCHNRNGLDEGETWRNVGLIHGENKLIPLQPLKASEIILGSFVTDVEKEKQYHAPTECKSTAKNNETATPQGSKYYFQQHITTACHHCLDPACLTGCPVKAYEKDPHTGIVRHLDDQCIGCKYCIYKCPYEVPQYNKARGIVRKCDMCTERLKEGEAPACVQSCPNEAIRITVVENKESAKDPGKNFKIPFTPNPNYTRPTTVYKSSRAIPDTVLPADYNTVLPQSAELPLVFMLVLTQASVGILLITFLLGESEPFQRIQSGTGFILGLLGLAVAPLHLGRPLYAYRSFLGFRTSWLSREAVFFGLFIPLALLTAIQNWTSVFGTAWEWEAIVLGIIGTLCSGMIYFDTPRAGWHSLATPVKFFLTAAILGVAETLFVLQWLKTSTSLEFLSALLLTLILLKASIEASYFLHLISKKEDALKKSVWLMLHPLKIFTILRWVTMIAGTLFILHSQEWVITGVGVLLLTVGECLERHLFFRAVVPPKMPGGQA